MKTAIRWAACAILAAAAHPAVARSPMSNGCGDGEANVPFAAEPEKAIGAEEIGGGSGEPGRAAVLAAVLPVYAPSTMSNGCGDGEANVPFTTEQVKAGAEEIGGGSGEPGRTAAVPEDPATRAEREQEFLRHVWTDP